MISLKDYFKRLKEISEFKEIPGSNGYVINAFGYIFNAVENEKASIKIDRYGFDYIALIIDGEIKTLSINHLVHELFGVRYNREDEGLEKLLLALDKELKKER